MKTSRQLKITLSSDVESKLGELAEKTGSISMDGRNSGKSSIRAMLYRMAMGDLIVCKPGDSPSASKDQSVKKGRFARAKDWKAWPKYPPKWWLGDMMGEMPLETVISKLNRTAQEIEAGGLVISGDKVLGLSEWPKAEWKEENEIHP